MIFPTLRSILLSLGAVVAAGTLGAVIGLSGVFSGPTVSGIYDPDDRRASVANCVNGTFFYGVIPAGGRVVIGYRNADTTWVGIVGSSVATATYEDIGWMPLELVTLDPGEPDLSTLPVGGACPEVMLADDPAPAPGPDPDPAPDPGGGGGPAPDTTPPTIGVPTITSSIVACDTGYPSPPTATVQAPASDDRGVSRVEIRWNGVGALYGIVGGSTLMTPGSPYTFVFDPPGGHSGGNVEFRIQAFDEAGNVSAQSVVSATVECLG